MWLVANCKNAVSSWEIHRDLGVTKKTAWFMLHRIRLGMQEKNTGGKLSGKVEADESFIGAKARNMHLSRRNKMCECDNFGKTIVSAVLERHGKVRATVMPNQRKKAIHEHVREQVEAGATVYSDELKSYEGLNEYTIRSSITQRHTSMDWSPFLRQTVKTQNPSNGELSHGSFAQAVHAGV
jgi:hypothetical protein